MTHPSTTTRARRLGAVAGPVLLGALLLAACGEGSDDGASASVVELSEGSTAFVVRPPETTVAPEAVAADATTTGSQEYTVVSGDYPLKVANQFGVSIDDLVAINEWGSAAEFPFPGTVILIPPGGTVAPAAEVAAVDPADPADPAIEAGPATTATTPAVTIPDAGDNCAAGSYTIAEGDYEGLVASNFDVTLDALRAANASTSGYGAFYAGLEIVIPAKADC